MCSCAKARPGADLGIDLSQAGCRIKLSGIHITAWRSITMVSSSVHIALAAIAGITLGAGATLALRPERQPSSEMPPTSPVGVPAHQGKKDKPLFPLPGGPERVYYGPVTGAQIVNRELSQLGSVGE